MSSAPLPPIYDTSSPEYKKARRQHLKTTKHRNDQLEADWTPFRAAEKKFKAKFPPPDLSDVLDLAVGDEGRVDEINSGGWRGNTDPLEWREIELEDTGRKAYILPRIPGAIPSSLYIVVVHRIFTNTQDSSSYPLTLRLLSSVALYAGP